MWGVCVRGGGSGGGGGGTCELLVPVLRPAETEETVSHRENDKCMFRRWGLTPPAVPSTDLVRHSATRSSNSCAEWSHKDKSLKKQLLEPEAKDSPLSHYDPQGDNGLSFAHSMRAQLHHQPLQTAAPLALTEL